MSAPGTERRPRAGWTPRAFIRRRRREPSREVSACALSFLFFLFLVARAWGAVPTLDHLHPAAVQPGITSSIVTVGKFDPWPPQAWVDDPAIHFQASTNKGEWSVIVDRDAGVGAHQVRLFNDEGASRPRVFIVEAAPQTREQEPNDDFHAPQILTNLPAVVNGRLEKSGDVDSMAVTLVAGQTLVAALDAYILESPVDGVLRVLDERGVQKAWNHDGRTLDPFLAFTATDPGRYVVQVFGFPHPATSEIRFYGNEKCVYRLRLSSGPFVDHTVPLGVSRSGTTRLHLAGWNLPAAASEIEFRGTNVAAGATTTPFHCRMAENALQLPVGDGPELNESEPNGRPGQANALSLPGAVTGCIGEAGDEDRFLFAAKKGQRLQLNVQAAGLGFPVDAWLKVEDTNGTQLARNDDARGADPELAWSAPSDGNFLAAVGNLLHRGGSNYCYRLSVIQPPPDFRIAAAEHSLAVLPGSTNDFKLTATRLQGFTNQITIRTDSLPEGISAAPVEVSEKGGEMKVTLVATTNAAPWQGTFRIRAVASDGTERSAVHSFVSTSENNGVPGGFRELALPDTDRLWLTVRKVEKPKAEKAKAASK